MADEIRVKLSADGLQEVLDAVRKVQAEAQRSSNDAARGTDNLRTSLISLRRVLSTLGIVTSVVGLAQFAKAAVTAALEVSESAKRIGLSARAYSRLQEAIRATKGDVEALDPAITQLRQNLSRALTNPTGESARFFKQLRIDAVEFSKLSLEQQFAQIADKVQALRSDEDRLRGTTDLLGKSAAGLVVTLKQGGDQFIEFADAAEDAGLVLQDDLAARLDETAKAVDRLKRKLAGATQQALAFVSVLFIPRDEIDAIDREFEGLLARKRQLEGPLKIGLGGDIAKQEMAAIDARLAELLKKQRKLLELDPIARKPKPPAVADEEELAVVETPEQRRARLAAERLKIQQELALNQERIRQRQNADQAAFDQDLISLSDYYARRLALAREASAAEIQALQRELAIVQATPAEDDDERQRLALDADRLRHDIALRRLKTETEIQALSAEQATEQRRLDEQWGQTLTRLDEAEGKRHAAFMRNLEAEIRAIEDLGRRAGQTAEQIAAQAERFRSASTARFTFEEAAREGQQALAAFTRDSQQIRLDQEAGLITQLEGENRLIALQRQRLQVLQQMAAAMQAAAAQTGDQALITQAQQFADSVKQIAASFDGATNAAARYRQGLESGLQSGLTDVLQFRDDIKSLEDAFTHLALTVIRSLGQIAAEILAKQATFALLRAIGVSIGAPSTAAPATGQRGGEVEGYAGGGKVRGRRLPIAGPDKIPALLQEGEHVIRRSAATQPGARAFLQAFNERRISMAEIRRGMESISLAPFIPHMAAGGPVMAGDDVAAGRSQSPGLTGVLGLEDGLVFRHLDSPAFEDMLVKKLAREPGRFRSALGL